MLLPILPESSELDLAPHGYKGCVAVYRPMDIEDKARWYADSATDPDGFVSMVRAVKRQLLTIRGIEVQQADGTRVPFDGTDDAHVRSLPMDLITIVFTALIQRTTLAETTTGN